MFVLVPSPIIPVKLGVYHREFHSYNDFSEPKLWLPLIFLAADDGPVAKTGLRISRASVLKYDINIGIAHINYSIIFNYSLRTWEAFFYFTRSLKVFTRIQGS